MKYRIVITGQADDIVLPSLIADVTKLTSARSGGFTFQVGTHAIGDEED